MLYIRVGNYTDFVAVAKKLSAVKVLYSTDGAGNYPIEAVGEHGEVLVAPEFTRVQHNYFPGVTAAQILADFPDALDTSTVVTLSFSGYVNIGTAVTSPGTSYVGVPEIEKIFGQPDALFYKLSSPGVVGSLYVIYVDKPVVAIASLVSDSQGTLVPESQIMHDYPSAVSLTDLLSYTTTP